MSSKRRDIEEESDEFIEGISIDGSESDNTTTDTDDEEDSFYSFNNLIETFEDIRKEIFKLLSYNYRDTSGKRHNNLVNTKIENYADMIFKSRVLDPKRTASDPVHLPVNLSKSSQSDIFPVFDAKFIAYDPLPKGSVWNESNAEIQNFKTDFIQRLVYLKEGKKIMTTNRDALLSDLFRPFIQGSSENTTIKEANQLFSIHKNSDAFVMIERESGETFVSQCRLIGHKDLSHVDDIVKITGVFKRKEGVPIDEYQVLDMNAYLGQVEELEEGDEVIVYPHDYIETLSHDGTTNSFVYKVVGKIEHGLQLNPLSPDKKSLFYNTKNLAINRFMLWANKEMNKEKNKSDPTSHITLQSSHIRQINTFIKFDDSRDITEQLKFASSSHSTILFHTFQNLQSLTMDELRVSLAKIGYDTDDGGEPQDALSRFLRTVIMNSLRPSTRRRTKRTRESIDIKKRVEDDPLVHMTRILYGSEGRMRLDDNMNRSDGGIINILKKQLKSLEKIENENEKDVTKDESEGDWPTRETTSKNTNETKNDVIKDEGRIIFTSFQEMFESTVGHDNSLGVVWYNGRHINVKNNGGVWHIDRSDVSLPRMLNAEYKFDNSVLLERPGILTVKKHLIEDIRQRESDFDLIPFRHKIREFSIDYSKSKRAYQGDKNKFHIDDTIQEGGGFGEVYTVLKQRSEDRHDDEIQYGSNSLKATKHAIEEIIESLKDLTGISLTFEEHSIVWEYMNLYHDKTKLLHRHAFARKQLTRALKGREDTENNKKMRDKLEKKLKKEMNIFDTNIIFDILALFVFIILVNRPKTIIKINYQFASSKTGYNFSKQDDVYFLKYMVYILNSYMNRPEMKQYKRNENSADANSLPIFVSLNSVTRDEIEEGLRSAFSRIKENPLFSAILNASDDRVKQNETVLVSKTWPSFRPYNIYQQQYTLAESSARLSDKQIISQFVAKLQSVISGKPISKSSLKNSPANEPTSCCAQRIDQYDVLIQDGIDSDISNSLELLPVKTEIKSKPIFITIPRSIRKYGYFKRNDKHIFWSRPLQIDLKERPLRYDIKTFMLKSGFEKEDFHHNLRLFCQKNDIFAKDPILQSYVQGDHNLMLKKIVPEIDKISESMSALIKRLFPGGNEEGLRLHGKERERGGEEYRERGGRGRGGIIGGWKEASKITRRREKHDSSHSNIGTVDKWTMISNGLIHNSLMSNTQANPIGRLVLQDYVGHLMNDLNIMMEREKIKLRGYMFDDSIIHSKKFIELKKRNQISDILEHDMNDLSIHIENDQGDRNKKLLSHIFEHVSLFHLDKLCQNFHHNMNDVQENVLIYNYVFMRQMMSIVTIIMKESEIRVNEVQASLSSVDDVYDLSLETVKNHSWNEMDKRVLKEIIDVIYRLYQRRKELSLVSQIDLKASFENSREEKKRAQMVQRSKWDDETKKAYFMMKDVGFAPDYIETLGVNIGESVIDLKASYEEDYSLFDSMTKDAVERFEVPRDDLFTSQGEGYDIDVPSNEEDG